VRVLVLGCGLAWVAVSVLLLFLPEVAPRTWVSLVFFLLLFGAATAYYFSLRVVVDEAGLTYLGLGRRVRLGWDDIVRLEIDDRLGLWGYRVHSRTHTVTITRAIRDYRHLMQLIVERANLVADRLKRRG
jgi:hypothetical protein